MKKHESLLIICVLTASLSFFLVSCEDVIRGSDTYFVQFRLDGKLYKWEYGLERNDTGDVFGGEACGFVSVIEGGTVILASSSPLDLIVEPTGMNAVMVSIPVTFPTEGTITASEPVTINIDGAIVWSCEYIADVSIKMMEEVGGGIRGTFSGFDPVNGTEVTDGYFYVKRISDDVLIF